MCVCVCVCDFIERVLVEVYPSGNEMLKRKMKVKIKVGIKTHISFSLNPALSNCNRDGQEVSLINRYSVGASNNFDQRTEQK